MGGPAVQCKYKDADEADACTTNSDCDDGNHEEFADSKNVIIVDSKSDRRRALVGALLRGAIGRARTEFPILNTMHEAIGRGSGIDNVYGAVEAARSYVRAALQPWAGDNERSLEGPFTAEIIACVSRASLDVDRDLTDWLLNGAPLGIDRAIPPSGYLAPTGSTNEPMADWWSAETDGLAADNYKSFVDCEDIALPELLREEREGFVTSYASREEAEAVHGKIRQNKLGCITKVGKRPRLVWDFRRSGVNDRCVVPERATLPRLSDAVCDVRELLLAALPGEEVELVVLDFKDAFKAVPLHPAERRFTAVYARGRWYIASRLPFGPKPSPLIWARFANWITRSTMGLWPRDRFRMQMYVDDPFIAIRGDGATRLAVLNTVLTWWAVIGPGLSWAKGQRGKTVNWIGASISAWPEHVEVGLPATTAQKFGESFDDLLGRRAASHEEIRSLAGRLAWMSCVVPEVRPFSKVLWAACNATGRGPAGIAIARIRHGVCWLRAFCRESRIRDGKFCRIYPVVEACFPPVVLTTDASPWGLGATLQYRNRIVAFLADAVRPSDAARFRTVVGSHRDQSLWESLAVLVAIRSFLQVLIHHPRGDGRPRSVTVLVQTDSMATIGAGAKYSSKDPRMNSVFREIALVCATHQLRIGWAHIAGADNATADALSRLYAPGAAHELPLACAHAIRRTVQPRDHDFWATWDARSIDVDNGGEGAH